MLHQGTNHTELKYIGVIVVLTTLIQLVVTEQGWKDILFVIQFMFVELFLILSFQELSQNLYKRVIELKRLNHLTQSTNIKLIRDVITLKGLVRGPHEQKETVYQNTNRVVMEALKKNAPVRRGRKLMAQHNKKRRTKPYVVKSVRDTTKPVEINIQEPTYVTMGASAVAQPCQDAQTSPVSRTGYADNPRESSNLVIKAENTNQTLNDRYNKSLESCFREQQHFCTKKTLHGRNVYERLCLNCSGNMTQVGFPIYSKICQTCKPVQGQTLTHYKRLSKFNNLIEYYCACELCFTSKEPPCLREYCKLCTVPRLTRKLNKEQTPLVEYGEWNGID